MSLPATPQITIDATGIHIPAFADFENWIQASLRFIYGADTYLGNDSQDGQQAGIFAKALYDTATSVMGAYFNYSPQTAQGAGLSGAVKINGIARAVPTFSTVPMSIGGQNGTPIINGRVAGDHGDVWLLPPLVTIPPAGVITVTATAATVGSVTADPGTVINIQNPTRGWQTATNTGPAVPGAPIEQDAALRQRQAVSTAIPSMTIVDGIRGAILALPGVTAATVYENDTSTTDSNGQPGHSVAAVVVGGDAQTIANTLYARKNPGTGTYGTTSETVFNAQGIPRTVFFFLPTFVRILVAITIKALQGYTATVGQEIVAGLVNYINAGPAQRDIIGAPLLLSRLLTPASLQGRDATGTPWVALSSPTDPNTFEITVNLFGISRNPATPTNADIVLAFNEVAFTTADGSDITLTVT
jgi:uncharacterized phage protein gp47/JayE